MDRSKEIFYKLTLKDYELRKVMLKYGLSIHTAYMNLLKLDNFGCRNYFKSEYYIRD